MNRVLSLLFVLLACVPTASVQAEVFLLRQRGNTLIEAENCSSASEEFPEVEPCRKCSGQHNLGNYWKGRWFEIEVEVAESSNFSVSLRASSATSTVIELQHFEPDSQSPTRLGEFTVPNTRVWENYINTEALKLPLSAGMHTLRFKNMIDGANIDYITFSAESRENVVSFHPPKNDGPDKNPLKGFGSGWWRPDDTYATIGFQYIEWGQLEPKDDQFNWEYVEEVLNREGTRGRHVILQFVVDWDYREPVDANYVGPDWLLKEVGEYRGHATPDDAASRPMRATKYDHPEYIGEAIEAIEALTGYFKDDPRVYILQAGPLGFWSEWHTFPRDDWSPSPRTKTAILATYLKHLPGDCFTQIRYPEEPTVKPQMGIGYTNGSAAPTIHGYEFGQEIEKRSLWKYGPITGEWPPNVERQFWQRFFLTDEGQRFINQARYSMLLMPEFKDIRHELPEWTPDGRFTSMHRELGYNLQVDRVRNAVTDDGKVHVEVTLGNTGIAPFYCDWDVQLAILDSQGPKVVELLPINTELRKLAPGGSTVFKAVSTKELKTDRTYQIGLRVLQPGADEIKPTRWPLDARNVYVVLANDIHVIEGVWNAKNALQGGWNVIGDVATDQLEDHFFAFQGSVRPADSPRPTPFSSTSSKPSDSNDKQWTNLLDADLSQWDVFMGIPHTSVDVDWSSKSDSGTEGTPMGLNNDPLKVFSVQQIDGEPVLCITGEIYGGLTSRKEYET